MQDFESYVKSNYYIPRHVSCGITYSYTSRSIIDKKSKTNMLIHCIYMKLRWYDRDNRLLQDAKLTFINDSLTKFCERQLTTIAPSEVTNKFRLAKPEIVRDLIKVKEDKLKVLQEDVNALYTYSGSSTSNPIIPSTMKGIETVISNEEPVKTNNSKTFDM